MLQRVILLAVLAAPAHAATPPADSLTVAPSGEATVRGVVLENLRDCERDLPCVLRLAVKGRPVHVIYHHGDSEQRCAQDALVSAGLALRAGVRIVARGRYSLAGAVATIDVCTPPGAQLRRAPH